MTTSPIHPHLVCREKSSPLLVIGIGSPHGDDRAGWEVIDRLSGLASRSIFLRKALVPHDVLNWLDEHLPTHIIDASCDRVPVLRQFAITQNGPGMLHFSALRPASDKNAEFAFDVLRSNSTHQLGLLAALELASALGQLPRNLCLWTVSAASSEVNGGIGTETRQRIDACVAAIAAML